MIAIIKTGGKQYSVKTGQILKVEKLKGKKGESILLENVLCLSDSSNHTVGDPLIKGAKVGAKIIDQIRDKKIIVFKKRKRQNYRSTQGHRQSLTVLKIETIEHNGKKTSDSSGKESKNKNNIIKSDKKTKDLKTSKVKKVAKKTNIAKKKITKKTKKDI